MDPRQDGELLEALAAGEVEAVGTLYDRHAGACLRMARRYARDDAEAQDAVHEAFAWVIRARPRLFEGTRFTTLLFPVLRSAAVNLSRRARREVTRERDFAAAVRGEIDERLARAVENLPQEQREVLLMRVVDEMSVEEVGVALGLPVGTVKSRLHRAILGVREWMGLYPSG